MNLPDHFLVHDDDPDLPPPLELERAGSGCRQKRASVAHDCADVQAPARVFLSLQIPLRSTLPISLTSTPGLIRSAINPQHDVVGHLRIVDQQLPAGALDEREQPLAGVTGLTTNGRAARCRAGGRSRPRRAGGLPRPACAFAVTTPKLRLFLMSRRVKLNRTRAAATVHDHHLAVVATRSSAVRETVTPAASSRISSLRRPFSPPRLVWAISARTLTPRATAVLARRRLPGDRAGKSRCRASFSPV